MESFNGEQIIEDKEGNLSFVATELRALRGGSFVNRLAGVHSAFRTCPVPTYRNPNIGFGLTRTLPQVPLAASPQTSPEESDIEKAIK